MKRRLADEKIAGGMEIMAGLAVSGALLLCLGILLLRLVVWLRFGYWSSHPIFSLLANEKVPLPKISWLAPQIVWDGLMGVPLEVVGPLMLIVLSFFLNKFADAERQRHPPADISAKT